MSSSETISIDLRKASIAPIDLQQTLGDVFFAALDQNEILGGEVSADIHIQPCAGETFRIQIDLKGQVRVLCDRCLEEVTLPVQAHEQMVLRYGDDSDPDYDEAYDVIVIPFTDTTYNLSWDLYEFIALALPLQRTHEDGECNEEMTQYILSSGEEDEDNDNE